MLDLEILEAVAERVGHLVRGNEDGRRFLLGGETGESAQQFDLIRCGVGGEKPERPLGLFRNLFGAREERGIGVELVDGELVEEIQEVRGRPEVSVQMMHFMRAAQGLKSLELCAHEGEDRLLFVAEEDADARRLFVVPKLLDDRELQGREVLHFVHLDPGIALHEGAFVREEKPGLEKEVVEVEEFLRRLVGEVVAGDSVDAVFVELRFAAVVVRDEPEGGEELEILLVHFRGVRFLNRVLGKAAVLLQEFRSALLNEVGDEVGKGLFRKGKTLRHGRAAFQETFAGERVDHFARVVFVEDRRGFGDDFALKQKF